MSKNGFVRIKDLNKKQIRAAINNVINKDETYTIRETMNSMINSGNIEFMLHDIAENYIDKDFIQKKLSFYENEYKSVQRKFEDNGDQIRKIIDNKKVFNNKFSKVTSFISAFILGGMSFSLIFEPISIITGITLGTGLLIGVVSLVSSKRNPDSNLLIAEYIDENNKLSEERANIKQKLHNWYSVASYYDEKHSKGEVKKDSRLLNLVKKELGKLQSPEDKRMFIERINLGEMMVGDVKATVSNKLLTNEIDNEEGREY